MVDVFTSISLYFQFLISKTRLYQSAISKLQGKNIFLTPLSLMNLMSSASNSTLFAHSNSLSRNLFPNIILWALCRDSSWWRFQPKFSFSFLIPSFFSTHVLHNGTFVQQVRLMQLFHIISFDLRIFFGNFEKFIYAQFPLGFRKAKQKN